MVFSYITGAVAEYCVALFELICAQWSLLLAIQNKRMQLPNQKYCKLIHKMQINVSVVGQRLT